MVPFSRSSLVVRDFLPRVVLMLVALVRMVASLRISKLTHSPVFKAFIEPKSLIFFVLSFILSLFFTNFMTQR